MLHRQAVIKKFHLVFIAWLNKGFIKMNCACREEREREKDEDTVRLNLVTSNCWCNSCSSVMECRRSACSVMLLSSAFFFDCRRRATCCSRCLVFLSSVSHLRCHVNRTRLFVSYSVFAVNHLTVACTSYLKNSYKHRENEETARINTII